MYNASISIPRSAYDYTRFSYDYPSYDVFAEFLRRVSVIFDKCVKDYNDIFKSVADFASKTMLFGRSVIRSGGKYSSLEYYNREFTSDHRLYFYMMQNWTYDLNKYIMSKFDGNWVYIPENKYTLMR